MKIESVRDLEVYKLAFKCAMEIFQITKTFPSEEKYSLTDQIRKSSRSVCTNLSESWRKRRYIAVFKNKLTDAMQEASETQTWLEFSIACNYVDKQTFERLHYEYEQILGKLNAMDIKAETFCFPTSQLLNFPTS
ncbi:MAG: four helix bundle protein [Candidatus Brocadiaceae bacterium]|nr:four helix bundle protein [Candidatus Brocadiaceae bacterium]